MFFVPSIYIALSHRRKSKYLSKSAAQSIFLWIMICTIYLLVRTLLLFLSQFTGYVLFYEALRTFVLILLWAYAVYCGYLSASQKDVVIPYVTPLANKVV